MFIYNNNSRNAQNFFEFDDKSKASHDIKTSRSRATKRLGSVKRSKKKLSNKNIIFLNSLGFEVKKN